MSKSIKQVLEKAVGNIRSGRTRLWVQGATRLIVERTDDYMTAWFEQSFFNGKAYSSKVLSVAFLNMETDTWMLVTDFDALYERWARTTKWELKAHAVDPNLSTAELGLKALNLKQAKAKKAQAQANVGSVAGGRDYVPHPDKAAVHRNVQMWMAA